MTITQSQRNSVVAIFEYMYAHEASFPYDEERPFDVLTYAELKAKIAAVVAAPEWDCDGFIVNGFHMAGLRDPSGFGYNGDGNTSTMLAYLQHGKYTDPAGALPGALVVFGADLPLADQHVCVVVEAGNNPMLISHGAPGVKRLTLSEEQTAHTGSTVFLSPGILG